MIKTVCFAVLLQFLTISAHAQFIAGNHGEGVLLNGGVYLRDLYMYDQLDELYFSESSLASITWKMQEFDRLPLTANQKKLLVRKLSEIEYLSPCLGQVVTDMLYMYRWRFTRESFPVPPENQPVGNVNEGDRVVIAKRFYSEILLQKKYWDQMSDGHKVALMLHEMLYAVLSPIYFPHAAGAGYQDVNILRSQISLIFSEPTMHNRSSFKAQLRYFDLPERIACEQPVTYGLKLVVDTGSTFGATHGSGLTDKGLERDIQPLCQKAIERMVPVEVTATTSPYLIQELSYIAFDGKDAINGLGQQTWNKICAAPVEQKSQIVSSANVESCLKNVKELIFSWTNARMPTRATKDCP